MPGRPGRGSAGERGGPPGDAAGSNAATKAIDTASHAIEHAGSSVRIVMLPAGEDPDSFLAKNGPVAMRALLDAALPLSEVLWKAETEGRDFSTPERRAGLERTLSGLTAQITDAKVADYYRRDFDQKIFDNFKRRQPAPRCHSIAGHDYWCGGC